MRVKTEVVVIELTTLALHIVDSREVAESTQLARQVQNLLSVRTVVADRLSAVRPSAHELLLFGLDVVLGLAGSPRGAVVLSPCCG